MPTLRRLRPAGRPARGELWLYDQLFRDLKVCSDLGGHVLLRWTAGMDLWFFPLGEGPAAYPGYRTFRPEELRPLGGVPAPRLLGLIVDGPLGREIRRSGLEAALQPLARSGGRRGTADAFDAGVRAIIDLVRATAWCGGAVVVADDLAGRDGPLAHPSAIRAALLPAYARIAEAIHATGRLALFHSDGVLTDLVGLLSEARLDGLAGYEVELYDFARAGRQTGPRWVLIGGLPTEWAAARPPSGRTCRRHVRRLSATAGVAWGLATSGGIADGGQWRNLLHCYDALARG